jgi:uncharacterized membrane protein
MDWWRHSFRRITGRIWFRTVLFSLGAVLLALASRALAPVFPKFPTANIGQDSVDGILQILASSMLAVTTFSLTAMVSAYSGATTLATPRATQLLLADPTSQNALSTFLGGFLFSIVGIIALSSGYYGDQGRIILFLGTIVVIAVIAVTLLRWISHVSGFGRMGDVIDRVERAATEAMTSYARAPRLRGESAREVAPGATAIVAESAGYVTLIDMAKLARIAEGRDVALVLDALPGTFAHPGRALLFIEGGLDAEDRAELASAFTIDGHRTFEQDPRFGLIVLSEIASRALSPAVNDPGTAIEILNSLHRVFLTLLTPAVPPETEVLRPGVHVPELSLAEMVETAYRPIARDGAGMVEVQIRLQKSLAALATACQEPEVFQRMAEDAEARARSVLDHAPDRDAIAAARRDAGLGAA